MLKNSWVKISRKSSTFEKVLRISFVKVSPTKVFLNFPKFSTPSYYSFLDYAIVSVIKVSENIKEK